MTAPENQAGSESNQPSNERGDGVPREVSVPAATDRPGRGFSLNPDELKALLGAAAAAPALDEAVVRLLLAGARPTELVAARAGDLTHREGTTMLVIAGRKTSSGPGQSRLLPLSGEAAGALRRCLAGRPSGLLLADDSAPLTRSRVVSMISRLARAAGIGHPVRPGDLRKAGILTAPLRRFLKGPGDPPVTS